MSDNNEAANQWAAEAVERYGDGRSYNVLHPFSESNPSRYYRVVEFGEWVKYISGGAVTLPMYGQYTDYRSAANKRDALNDGTEAVREGFDLSDKFNNGTESA